MEDPTFAIHTLGCRVNQYDSESIQAAMERAGYRQASPGEPADVLIVNTCAVTGEAARKSRQAVRRARRRNPEGLVVMAGCFPQAQAEQARQVADADLLVGTGAMDRIPQLLAEPRDREVVRGNRPFNGPVPTQRGRGRALLKIQEGCLGGCTYCLVPRARGRPRSRPPRETLDTAQVLVAQGHREIVLTGVHLASWGRDLGDDLDLAWLLAQLEVLEGEFRLRLSSLEPMDIDDRFLEAAASLSRVCHHLHLPLQSGSDRVLGLMNRPYTAGSFLRLVRRARRLMPDLGLTTDVMVGFPGEGPAEFLESVRLLREAEFSRLHVFPFSPRAGTPAARMSGQVPGEIKEARKKELLELDGTLREAFHRRFLGCRLEALLERDLGEGFSGYTRNYIPVTAWGDGLRPGQLVTVRILEADADGVAGPARLLPSRGRSAGLDINE